MSEAKRNPLSRQRSGGKKRGGGGRKRGAGAKDEGAQKFPVKMQARISPHVAKLSSSRALLVLNEYVEHLAQLAETGEDAALQYLHHAFVQGIDRLYQIIECNPELAAKVRTPGQPWPLLTSDLKVNRESYLTVPKNHLLRRMGVLRKGQKFYEEAPGTKAAIELHKIIEHYRRFPSVIGDRELSESFLALKPLSPANFEDWWSLAEKWIVKWWGFEFQDHSDFKGWKGKNYDRFGGTSARSIKRSDIKKAIKQGLRSIARNLGIAHPG